MAARSAICCVSRVGSGVLPARASGRASDCSTFLAPYAWISTAPAVDVAATNLPRLNPARPMGLPVTKRLVRLPAATVLETCLPVATTDQSLGHSNVRSKLLNVGPTLGYHVPRAPT